MTENLHKRPKKELIMEEAEKIFSEKGFHGASTRDIAKATKCNIAMLYYYFKDKEALYSQILEHTMKEMYEKTGESINKGKTPEEKIRFFVNAYIEFMGSKKKFARIIAREMVEGGEFIKPFIEKYFLKNLLRIREVIKTGIEDECFNECDVDLAPLSIMGMMGFFFFGYPIVKNVLKLEDYNSAFLDSLSSHTVNLINNGLKRNTCN